ncbi:MAG: hypothetical protein ABI686_00785 [Acidobacteriota bacterium]
MPKMQTELKNIFECIPNFDLSSGRKITGEFLSLELKDFHVAANHV